MLFSAFLGGKRLSGFFKTRLLPSPATRTGNYQRASPRVDESSKLLLSVTCNSHELSASLLPSQRDKICLTFRLNRWQFNSHSHLTCNAYALSLNLGAFKELKFAQILITINWNSNFHALFHAFSLTLVCSTQRVRILPNSLVPFFGPFSSLTWVLYICLCA